MDLSKVVRKEVSNLSSKNDYYSVSEAFRLIDTCVEINLQDMLHHTSSIYIIRIFYQ